MKRFFLSLAGLALAVVAAAMFVPGFWAYMPSAVKDRVPEGWRAGLNMPVASADAKPAAPQGRGQGGGGGAGGGRPTPVVLGKVDVKSVPVRVETVGTVQAIASVVIRPRVDSQITEILFADGASVKEGDVLVRLDSRAIEAQIKQAEANLARDRAALDLARRTLKRGEELADSNFATKQRLDENRSAVATQEAQLRANEAALDNLKTQLTYYTIRSPISGKAGVANLKPGNIAQAASAATTITTINQMAPIYVSFSLPQRYFQDLRDSIARGDSVVEATLQGASTSATGKLALVDNIIDNATGSIGVRAIFPNAEERLWPGAIVNLKVTLRVETNVVTVPREAVQMSQRGSFVFAVKDGVAKMQLVSVGRAVDKDVIVTKGLSGGEMVITDGQLLVNDGARVVARGDNAPASGGGQSGGGGGRGPGGGGRGPGAAQGGATGPSGG
jgi:RND family efflux transporter MFP subunit